MRTKFVAGNWKMNTNKASAVALATAVAKGTPASAVEVGIAVPFVYLDAVNQAIAGTPLLLGAQDAYFEKEGAFTGEIAVSQLKDVGVTFVLTGHSERVVPAGGAVEPTAPLWHIPARAHLGRFPALP